MNNFSLTNRRAPAQNFVEAFFGNSGLGIFPVPVKSAWAEDKVDFYMDMPGMRKEDIVIEVHDRKILVQAVRKDEVAEKDSTFYSNRSYEQVFTLPQNASTEDIIASYDAGVLKVSVSLIPETAPKRIEVVTLDSTESAEPENSVEEQESDTKSNEETKE